jgi:2-methylcitrate dehydratase PrpD
VEETRILADFVNNLTYEDLPATVIGKTKELILDQLGCQLAGSTLPLSKVVYEYVKEFSGQKAESTVVNYGLKTAAKDAAFANANFGHAFMGDDTDSVCHAHLGSILIPAAIAVGEKNGISGKDLITAIVAGYEVSSRIGAAARTANTRGFHPGPIFGPFGVAASCGKLMGFDKRQLLDAIGIAGSQCAGLMEYSISGGTVNKLHSGAAAYSGIRTALMVQKGFSGPPTIIEGDRGFLHAYSGESFPGEITRGLGQEFRVKLIDLKPYCCCGTAVASLDALSKITSDHIINTDLIEEVIVYAPKISQVPNLAEITV